MATRSLAVAVAVGWSALLIQGRCAAGAATDQVKETVDEIVKVTSDPAMKGPAKTKERRARIREAVLKRFSFDAMAKRSLGTHWNERTPSERAEFVRLFTDLLERSYIAQVEGYSGEQIQYKGESVDGNQAEVRSVILGKGGEQTTIVYRLERDGGVWHVYDLVIDGVSLVNNYRVQFARIVASSSYEELVKKMRTKLAAEQGRGG